MKSVSCFIALLTLSFLFHACKPKKQYDLSGQQVTIIAPIAATLQGYTQTLSWARLEDAVSYRSIFSPANAPDSIVLDTVIINNSQSFSYTFKPGDYHWKIKASNGISSTGFSFTTFSIAINELNEDAPVLLFPKNSGYSNDTTLLTWRALYQDVDGYQVQINSEASFEGTMLKDVNSDTTFYAFKPVLQDAHYWRVRGYTASDTSQWSTVYAFTYDTIAPAQPILSAPSDGSTGVAQTGSLSWDVVTDAATYNLYITYGTAAEKKISTLANSYNFSGNSGETVSWKVEAVDAAGNVSAVSDTWTFTIQ